MSAEDDRLARSSRLIRRQRGLRQHDLRTSRHATQEIESGRAGSLRLDLVRAHFAGLGAKGQFAVWWNGAALDRLLDASHAQVVEAVARVLPAYGFRVKTEHSYSVYGERGSIDVFAGRDDVKALFVGEIKSEWGSLEQTLRIQDAKVRLAPQLAQAAFGWTPAFLANVLILPDDRTARRVVDRFPATFAEYGARGREVRAWLRHPEGEIRGVWFLSNIGPGPHGSE